MQNKQSEWLEQWKIFKDNEISLFKDWIFPATLEDFKDKEVLECGCGGGQHTYFIAPLVKKVVAVDLNTVDIAKRYNKGFENIDFIEADIADIKLEHQFDIVLSIGVIHHTDNPEKTVDNLIRHLKPGGKLIFWVYSKEGNLLMEKIVEPLRKVFFRKLSRKTLLFVSKIVCAFLYLPVYTIYLLPLTFLPYYRYFENFRKLSFQRNLLNVFDKLNAPQVEFLSYQRVKNWFSKSLFSNIIISPYKDVSWRINATKSLNSQYEGCIS